MGKKRIIHFSVANTKGGITQYVLNNWKHIDKEKFQFDVVTFGGKLDFQEELEAEGCKVLYVQSRAEDNLEGFCNEISKIFSNGYDIVHLHTSYWKSFELEKLARQAGIPKIIVHSHNTAVFDDNGREEKEKQHYRLRNQLTSDIATDYWACSKVAADWLYADKISEEKIRIMHNAIDVPRFTFNGTKRQEIRHRMGWENNLVIGHVGRFSYQKNHIFLIEVFKEVVKKNEKARLVLIGKGPLENDIKLLVENYNLADKVYFVGTCDNVDYWFEAMDVFALPSHFEGLPIVVIEAQASGVKCLVSDKITRETAITDNISFLPLNIHNWTDKIISENRTKNRKQYAEQVIQADYDINEYIKNVEFQYSFFDY